MNGQGSLLTTYERLVHSGIDMGWYDRAKAKSGRLDRNKVIPLADTQCYSLSIYILKKDGTLWTCNTDGTPYDQVRNTGKHLPKDTLLCVCCKRQFKTIEEAKKHYEKG